MLQGYQPGRKNLLADFFQRILIPLNQKKKKKQNKKEKQKKKKKQQQFPSKSAACNATNGTIQMEVKGNATLQ